MRRFLQLYFYGVGGMLADPVWFCFPINIRTIALNIHTVPLNIHTFALNIHTFALNIHTVTLAVARNELRRAIDLTECGVPPTQFEPHWSGSLAESIGRSAPLALFVLCILIGGIVGYLPADDRPGTYRGIFRIPVADRARVWGSGTCTNERLFCDPFVRGRMRASLA
eukprot:1181533-Prorocentrum_minimum.AAC.1